MTDIEEMIRELTVIMGKALENAQEEGGAVYAVLMKLRAEGYEVLVVLDVCVGHSETSIEDQSDTPNDAETRPQITSSDRTEMRKLGFDPALRPPKNEEET